MAYQERWAAAELAPWRRRGLTRASLRDRVDAAAANHGGAFRYDVSRTGVVLHDKPGAFLGAHVPPEITREVAARAESYRALLEQSLPLLHIGRAFSLVIDVSDLPPRIADLPLFSFQKSLGADLILLPDIDLLRLGFLEDEQWVDRVAFSDKINKAIFVGSSTGGHITREQIETLALPRLRAAVFFKGNPHVAFTLPKIVQYDTQETQRLVEGLGVGGPPLSWDEQLGCRHILSMDGNGATCSRVAIALNSNSVLMKYDSPHHLFYFKGLRPWVHYVAINDDSEVEPLVVDSARDMRRYSRIGADGRRFFHNHLRRDRCIEYVAALLQAYLEILNHGEGATGANLRARTHYDIMRTRRLAGRGWRFLRDRLQMRPT